MPKETLHGIEFYEEEEYEQETFPECLYEVQAESLPVPSEGDVVDFGWHEKDGERVDHVHFNATNEGDAEYVRSEQYRVISISHHYHNARETTDNGTFITNRVEVSTTVIVRPTEEHR